jgi:2-dehydro-3-deoxyphosphooctonate aldolase (KDO 8-P synthase)
MRNLDFEVGINQPFFLIAGPCVIESETLALETATYLQQVTEDLGINFIYKTPLQHLNL